MVPLLVDRAKLPDVLQLRWPINAKGHLCDTRKNRVCNYFVSVLRMYAITLHISPADRLAALPGPNRGCYSWARYISMITLTL